jgi:hypothetical protein
LWGNFRMKELQFFMYELDSAFFLAAGAFAIILFPLG